MIKTPIRNLHSDKLVPPRFCDVVIEDGKVFLEKSWIRTSTKKFPGRMLFTR